MVFNPKKSVQTAKDIVTKGPKKHHFFYAIVVVCGWFLPPLAVIVRFGFGKDFLINVLLTVCGYLPGHGHNFYLQNIRNNKGRHRTPKWAVRAGLIEVDDPSKKPKHQWANRYEERNAVNTYNEEESASSGSPNSANWDGRGPQPPPKEDKFSGQQKHSWAPWGTHITADELEYSPQSAGREIRRDSENVRNGNGNSNGSGSGNNDFREEFYQTDGLQEDNMSNGAGKKTTPQSQSGKMRSLVTGTKTGGGKEQKSDRFDRMERARRGNEGEQGDWERRNDIGYHNSSEGDAVEWNGNGGDRKTEPKVQKSNVDDLQHNF